MENLDLSGRIMLIIKELGVTQTAFAKSLDTSATRISNIIQRRNKPDAQLLEKIAEVYSQVDANWLLTGRGDWNRNVKISGYKNPEDNNNKNIPDTLLGTLQNALLDPLQPPKTGRLGGVKRSYESFNRSNADVPPEFAHLMHQYEQARSELEQQEWRNIDRRLKSVAYNILLVQEMAEELVGTPFDRDFFPALQKHVVTPRLTYKGNAQFANPLNEMDYDTKSKYYADRAVILEQSEEMFDDLLRELHSALFSPTPDRIAPNPRQDTIAEVLHDFLKARFEKRWREKWKA